MISLLRSGPFIQVKKTPLYYVEVSTSLVDSVHVSAIRRSYPVYSFVPKITSGALLISIVIIAELKSNYKLIRIEEGETILVIPRLVWQSPFSARNGNFFACGNCGLIFIPLVQLLAYLLPICRCIFSMLAKSQLLALLKNILLGCNSSISLVMSNIVNVTYSAIKLDTCLQFTSPFG